MARLSWPTVAVLGGVVWGLCHGREALPLASWLALVPLLLLLGHRRAAWLGLAHGVAYWLTAVVWIAPTMRTYGHLSGWLSVVVLVLLGLILGAYTWAFALLGRRIWLRGGAAALVGLPALWVALEWLRTYLWSGFPWNLAGYAWEGVPGALELSAWIGIYGISFLILFANTAVARAVVLRRPFGALVAIGACWVVLAFGARWAGGPSLEELRGPVREVRLIQPDIRNLVDWDPAENRAGYRRLLRLSDEACDVPGALLVWPESAAWPRESSDPELRRDLESLARRGCSVIFNSVQREAESYYNSALMHGEGGIAGRYDKRHLVPYGEYVPMAEWLTFVGTVARMAGQFSAGDAPRLLDWAGERLGMAICFEVIFPAEVAELVRAGATLLVTITNDGWYGDTSAPWQHFRAARFRAAEMRRPMLRSAITGVSAVVGPDGQVVRQLGVFEEGVIRIRLRGHDEISPAARRPWLVPLGCSAAAAFAIFLGARGRTRRP